MAQLPPDGEYLIQQIDGNVIVFQRHSEAEIARWPVGNPDLTAKAQKIIHDSPELTDEGKSMAHFWAGYFYGRASEGGF